MYPPFPVFSLVQLNVAFSRAPSFDNVAIAISEEYRQRIENYT
jgi:hypothetical protein